MKQMSLGERTEETGGDAALSCIQVNMLRSQESQVSLGTLVSVLSLPMCPTFS